MKTTAPVDPNALHYQEVVFSLVMTVAAVLSRENPLLSFPGILWSFLGLLSFNLVYHVALRRGGSRWVPLVSMAVNVGLISLVLAYSGGDQSPFWPLYLLPGFTACLYLERRHAAGAVAAAASFLALFYLDAFWELRRWEACEFLIKLGVLALSAAVTAQLSFKERGQRRALDTSRERIEALAQSLERRRAEDMRAMKRESLATIIPGLASALNNPLAVVLGTVELMLKEAPEGTVQRQDLERIRAAALRCARVGDDLLAYSRAELEVL